jgi:hypothetical protein
MQLELPGKDIPRPIRWANFTDDYRVRGRPEQVLEAFDAIQKKGRADPMCEPRTFPSGGEGAQILLTRTPTTPSISTHALVKSAGAQDRARGCVLALGPSKPRWILEHVKKHSRADARNSHERRLSFGVSIIPGLVSRGGQIGGDGSGIP